MSDRQQSSRVSPTTPMARARSRPGRPFLGALLAASLTVAGLAACGESSSEKATKQVCSATGEISTQIKKLETLPISSNFPTEAKASVEAIDKSIKKIEEAAPNLPSARKEEVAAANKAFQTEIVHITKQVATASQSSNVQSALKSAEPQIRTALSRLSGEYHKAFQELKCS
jgi:uncharacterized protein YicC (UPF0701 family)